MSGDIPELPNFIQILYNNYPDQKWVLFLHRFEDLFFSLIVIVAMVLLCYWGVHKKALIPGKLQNGMEFGLETLQNLIMGILGPEGAKHLPFLGTLFIYVLMLNWAGLIPLMKSPSSSLDVTASLAICVFCYVQYLNIKNMGVLGFLYHLAGSPKGVASWLLVPLILPLELLAQISRPVTLALRLFGNILGEHILLGVFAILGVVWLAAYAVTLTVPLQIPFVFLALLTGFMQALVFTMLSTVYILLSIPHKEHSK
jgi:F-type H+-transporting ATPase subunit a